LDGRLQKIVEFARQAGAKDVSLLGLGLRAGAKFVEPMEPKRSGSSLELVQAPGRLADPPLGNCLPQ